jgi:hypothetical protein
MLEGISKTLDIATFDEQVYFEDYHHYEVCSPTKTYTPDTFVYDYGHGQHTYVYKLYTIYLKQNNETVKENIYIVVEEVLSKQELNILKPYCQCYVCTSNWYNISKYFTCRCCIGCLHSPLHTQGNINNARQYMLNN